MPGSLFGHSLLRGSGRWAPVDGKIFFALDLALTAVADTTLLLVSVFMKPKRPRYGFAPGCTWVERR
jgi:hypothetical protein